jgi:hypothetical protein
MTFKAITTVVKQTRVAPQTLSPHWDEKLVFVCRRAELPPILRVECYDKRHLTGDEFIGSIDIDLGKLVLEDPGFARWYRLEDPDLKHAALQRRREEERLHRLEINLRKGILLASDEDDEENDDEDGANQGEPDAGTLAGGGGWFAMNLRKGRGRTSELFHQLDAGKDPDELGRIKIRLVWSPVDTDQDLEGRALWDQRLKDPAMRRIMQRVMMSWVNSLLARAFNQIKRVALLSIRQSQVCYTCVIIALCNTFIASFCG